LNGSGAGYLLWMISSYTAATTVLLASFGRIADIYGKVRFYKAGFIVFGAASLLCGLTPSTGDGGAIELIVFRVFQGVGGAMLSATSLAILTDTFPPGERGFAFAINQLAFVGGNVVGVILGGILAFANWRYVFLISVPIGLGGALWSHRYLKETGQRAAEPPDWQGNVIFGISMLMLMLGLTYALVPFGGASSGWANPFVVLSLALGICLLGIFVVVEGRVSHPMFDLALLRNRAFTAAGTATFFFAIARGGLQFILIIWLQAVWLPLHGVSFARVPLQAGLDLLPMMLGFLLAAPVSGWLGDRYGAKLLSTGGLLVIAASMLLLMTLPANFDLFPFAVYIFFNGIGIGVFAAPNNSQLMNSVPASRRGIAAGMRQTLNNTGALLSTAFFLTIVVGGLSASMPAVVKSGLADSGVPPAAAARAAAVPAGSAIFAALLGDNPIQQLLGRSIDTLPPRVASKVTAEGFFATLISVPMGDAMRIAFLVGALSAIAGAIASYLRGSARARRRPSISTVASKQLEETRN
jgi:MFS family permease